LSESAEENPPPFHPIFTPPNLSDYQIAADTILAFAVGYFSVFILAVIFQVCFSARFTLLPPGNRFPLPL